MKLNRAPGTAYEYGTDGYAVAGLVIQAVSGLPVERGPSTFVLRGEVGGLEGYPIRFAVEGDDQVIVLLGGRADRR